MTLSRGGFELNEIWAKQMQSLREAEESPEAREARVLGHHEKGEHTHVLRALVDHHSTMSDKERGAYNKAAKAAHSTVPPVLHRINDARLGKALVRWSHFPSEHGEVIKAYNSMDTEQKMAHATHVADSWHKLRERNGKIDKDGYLTVYRRPTKQDTHKGFKGREGGGSEAAKDHDWGGSSWSINPWHVGQEAGHRPGLKTRVHHSQVLGHSHTYDWHKRIGGYQLENEVFLKPDAKIKAEPCGGDPAKHSHGPCSDKDPGEIARLQHDARKGRYPGAQSGSK